MSANAKIVLYVLYARYCLSNIFGAAFLLTAIYRTWKCHFAILHRHLHFGGIDHPVVPEPIGHILPHTIVWPCVALWPAASMMALLLTAEPRRNAVSGSLDEAPVIVLATVLLEFTTAVPITLGRAESTVPSILARPIGVSAVIIASLTRAAITKTAIGAALVASEIWPVGAAEIPVTSVTTTGILIAITAAEAAPARCVVPKLASPEIASNVATTTIVVTIGVAVIVAALTTTLIFWAVIIAARTELTIAIAVLVLAEPGPIFVRIGAAASTPVVLPTPSLIPTVTVTLCHLRLLIGI
jgi:hypothetical protein